MPDLQNRPNYQPRADAREAARKAIDKMVGDDDLRYDLADSIAGGLQCALGFMRVGHGLDYNYALLESEAGRLDAAYYAVTGRALTDWADSLDWGPELDKILSAAAEPAARIIVDWQKQH